MHIQIVIFKSGLKLLCLNFQQIISQISFLAHCNCISFHIAIMIKLYNENELHTYRYLLIGNQTLKMTALNSIPNTARCYNHKLNFIQKQIITFKFIYTQIRITTTTTKIEATEKTENF